MLKNIFEALKLTASLLWQRQRSLTENLLDSILDYKPIHCLRNCGLAHVLGQVI